MDDDPFVSTDHADPFQNVETPADGTYDPIQDTGIDMTQAPADGVEELKESAEPAGDGAEISKTSEEDENVTFLSVWEEQRKQTLEERRKTEDAEKQKVAETAQEEIKQFVAKRREQIAQNQKANRAAESDFKEDMAKVFKEGTIWQQVGKMVDLKSSESTNRPERMKTILIQLKNNKA